jgi:hypothetical protein
MEAAKSIMQELCQRFFKIHSVKAEKPDFALPFFTNTSYNSIQKSCSKLALIAKIVLKIWHEHFTKQRKEVIYSNNVDDCIGSREFTE